MGPGASETLTLGFTTEKAGKGHREGRRQGSQIEGVVFIPLCVVHMCDVCAMRSGAVARLFQGDSKLFWPLLGTKL